MLKRLLLLIAVPTLLWSCSTIGTHGSGAGKSHDTPQTPDGPEPPDVRAMEAFQVRLDSALTLFYFGDVPNFYSTQDSLRRDVAAYLEEHPSAASDPGFHWLQVKIEQLDTLMAGVDYLHPYIARMDSLALAHGHWPEDDTTNGAARFQAVEDTVFPAMRNRRIDFWIRYFCGPGRKNFERALYRMELHRPTIENILEELDLPNELICLALIESGFNLKARSRAKAVGPWQFISGTARLYGLRVNWWLDERRDIVAASYAAGNYLKDLYSIWDSWFLAMAAYNAGEYRVARAVARHRTKNFWKLRLPKQTQRYVPKFLAALYIAREPEKYGFKVPDVEPISFDLVPVKDATDINLIAESCGVSVETIKSLNPALLRWCTPPKTELLVKVPEGSGQSCETALASIPAEKRVTWRRHTIRRGETLSLIARKYRTTVTTLKRLNGIRNSHFIREGRTLIVPLMGAYAEVASSKPQYKSKRRSINKKALESYAKSYAPPKGYKSVIYRVKDGDTLGEIAENFRTSARKLRRWNNLSYRSYIHPGQKLVVYVPESFDLARAPVLESVRPMGKNYVRSRYVVKKGDTLYAISKRFNVRVSDLLMWNGKSRSSVIYPGEVLEIWTAK
ncbi:MAG: LysM peptidoglycan-binding domain-containing protein [Candidatus Latescibacteria bacterium]|nr:LysM peptidoglycan-binding domain-containing protein [Candidatus Latescibacterota bacterium]NIM21364.1 LysM peptidoglycan-binding domain-containing protein [Candidatus Latescibacterota bacterium]NIM65545.1 LysM peptidoglycan-binding domain-containing protein [Candidatus Latescibacterota bacterium]NIO01925.1 LysM peptidoglycan-binding domain-containing protein [Candidatus Latescibacterota bacterium]NIO28738.1 LysM peptidoglycan-binding domain-containing protein [Candidatus Latescibacterota ba